jgi:CreA protein
MNISNPEIAGFRENRAEYRGCRPHRKRLYESQRRQSVKRLLIVVLALVASSGSAMAADLACISTTFNLLSPNDKVCVSAFEDPEVPGVVCHISQARKGGWGQALGLNEDPSNFSVACRQTGPITVELSALKDREEVFTQRTSIFFKKTRIYRLLDRPHNALVYLAISSKIINGSPANAISTVPIMPWGAAQK